MLVLGRPSTAVERGPRARATGWHIRRPVRGGWGVPRAAPPFVAGNGGPRPRPLRGEALTSNDFARDPRVGVVGKGLNGGLEWATWTWSEGENWIFVPQVLGFSHEVGPGFILGPSYTPHLT